MDEISQLRQQLYLDSFYHFSKFCLGYKDLNERVHGPICKALQEPTKRKLIVIPRSCYKSSIATIAYPMWKLLHDPNERVLIDSELFSNSVNFLREIRGHYEHNQLFKELFGDYVGSTWGEAEIIIKKRTVHYKEPSIVCSGIGAGKTSQHYSLIVADDLSSYKNCRTKDLAQKTIDHYKLYTSLLEPNGTIVVIGTRYSETDLIRFIIENELEIKDGDINVLRKIYG